MNTAKTIFVLFFAAIIVGIIFTSRVTGDIIKALGGALSDVSGGILAPGGKPITQGG